MSLDALGERLADSLEGRVERNRGLARLTTSRVGGAAAIYVEPAGAPDLASLGRALGGEDDEVPLLALGRGSNLVVSDEGWPGIVVRLGEPYSWVRVEGEAVLVAGGGRSLPLVSNFAARRGLSGLEWGVGVPGSVGGAVVMNAGAHGGDTAAILVSATVFDLGTLEVYEHKTDELEMSYRHTNLGERHIVLEARLSLAAEDPGAIKATMEEYRRYRAATQPGAAQNAGSTFKNPPGDSAGRLVEAAGLKGHRVGGASVSELHANFFVAGEGASAQDVFDLVHEVAAVVNQRLGVELEPEVRFAGPFRPWEEPS